MTIKVKLSLKKLKPISLLNLLLIYKEGEDVLLHEYTLPPGFSFQVSEQSDFTFINFHILFNNTIVGTIVAQNLYDSFFQITDVKNFIQSDVAQGGF